MEELESDSVVVGDVGSVDTSLGGFNIPKNFSCAEVSTGFKFTGKVQKDGKVWLAWSQADGHSDTSGCTHNPDNFRRLFIASQLEDLRATLVAPYVHPEADASAVVSAEGLGVYRPVLEDRKVGKVRVELVDFGFPNALWQVAQVMTWAGETKGYKDHDWQNLPDAKNAFPAAASRHRMKHIMAVAGGQKLNEDGFTDEGYTDEESKYFHKAHEAFNILCELELMCTGKITTKK